MFRNIDLMVILPVLSEGFLIPFLADPFVDGQRQKHGDEGTFKFMSRFFVKFDFEGFSPVSILGSDRLAPPAELNHAWLFQCNRHL